MPAERLLLKGELTGEVWSWLTLDSGGRVAAGPASGTLEQAAEVASGRQVVWLVGSEDIRIEERRIPAGSRKQLAQAVPYALEDELAEDVAELHFAFVAEGERVSVAVVRRALLREALDRLNASGIFPAKALPDCLAVPWEPESWGMLVDRDRVLLRSGPYAGLACDASTLPLVIGAALADMPEEGRPDRIRIWDCAGLEDELPELPLEVESRACVSAMELMAEGLAGGAGIDLLQGEFSARERQARQLRRWWPVAAAAVLWATLAVVDKALEVGRMEREQVLLSQAIEQVFRESFPDARIVEPRTQMEQRLESLRGQQGKELGFLPMLARSVPPLQARSEAVLKGIEYRNRVLELSLEAGDVQQLDALRQALESRGDMRAEIQSVNVEGGRVAARIRLRQAAG